MSTRHPIPDAALASHIAILGKTGSGKTYAAKGLVESVLEAGGRVCVIDPTGAWHSLRSSASGKRAGYPVVIFGGAHADLPLGGAHAVLRRLRRCSGAQEQGAAASHHR